MKKYMSGLILYAVSVSILSAQALKPERSVQANTVTSASDPRLRIKLPKQAKYLGSDRWLLFGIIDCEVHVFVEADAHKIVQRLYWVQFEGYIPSRPELKYDYSSNRVQKVDGLDFYTRAQFGPADDPVKAGSDAEHVRQLVQAAGYTMPPGIRNIRLVHLPDERQRRELMVIYEENLATEGVQWKDLLPGGKAADRWPKMQQDLMEHLKKRIRFIQ
jgi:hypothetical protein